MIKLIIIVVAKTKRTCVVHALRYNVDAIIFLGASTAIYQFLSVFSVEFDLHDKLMLFEGHETLVNKCMSLLYPLRAHQSQRMCIVRHAHRFRLVFLVA